MLEYVTVADVDVILGAEWTTPEKKSECVLKANIWLNSKITKDVGDPVPDNVKLAGAQMAKLAASGGLYGSVEREVTAQKASATSGTFVEKEFRTGSLARSAEESFALALIAEWIGGMGSVIMLKRI